MRGKKKSGEGKKKENRAWPKGDRREGRRQKKEEKDEEEIKRRR